MLERLKPLLEDPAVLKIGHNLKYDWVMFAKHGIEVAPYDDTMVMSFDLDAGRHGHGLDELAKLHFDHECIPFKQLCGTGAKQITFDQVPLDAGDRICRRGRRHHAAPVAAAEAAPGGGERRRGSMRWSTGRWSPAIGRMERRGVKVDRDYLAKLSSEFSNEIAALEERVYEAAGGPFTIGVAAAARPGAVRAARPEGRAQGQERHLFDRRQRARAAGGGGRRMRRGWCSTGAS